MSFSQLLTFCFDRGLTAAGKRPATSSVGSADIPFKIGKRRKAAEAEGEGGGRGWRRKNGGGRGCLARGGNCGENRVNVPFKRG
jgi:hypothetical protein